MSPSRFRDRHWPNDLDQPNASSTVRKLGRLPRSLSHALHTETLAPPPPLTTSSHGNNARAGNLLAIQAWITPEDLFHIGTYARCWERYFQQAHTEGWLTPQTIVVLPEHIGTWLVMSHEGSLARESRSFASATQWIAVGHPLEMAEGFLARAEPTPFQVQVFRNKAERMASQYQRLFGRLARKYQITLVAGSIVLPSPWIQGDQLCVGDGPLLNVSLTFRPDGTPFPQLTTKTQLTRIERAVLTSVTPSHKPIVYETPAGPLCVRLGADAWFRCPTLPGDALLAAPAFSLPHRPNPLLFPTPDVRAGVLVAAQGHLWDTQAGGPALFHQRSSAPVWQESTRAEAGSLLNLWLTPTTH